MKRELGVLVGGFLVLVMGLIVDVAPAFAAPLFGASTLQEKNQDLRRYPLKGVVRALVKDERLAMIKHQDVPG